MSWETIGFWLDNSHFSRAFFLACNSATASIMTNKPSIGFNGIIDGIAGALAIAANLAQVRGNIKLLETLQARFMDRFIGLITGSVEWVTLYYSQEEQEWNGFNVIMIAIAAILTASSFLIKSYLKSAIVALATLIQGVAPAINGFINLVNSGLTIDGLLNFLLGTFGVLIAVVCLALSFIPWWEIWKVGVVSAEMAAKLTAVGLAVNIVAIFYWILSSAWTFSQMLTDMSDPDPYSRVKWW